MSEVTEDETKQDDEVDENLQKTIEADAAINKFLAGDEFLNDVLGIKLKPVTLASLAIMQDAGCQIISGIDVEEMDNLMLEILLFVYIHTEEHKVLTNIICSEKNPKAALKEASLNLGVDINPKQIPSLVEQIVKILTDATGTKVDPLPDEGDEIYDKKKQKDEE